MRPHEISAFQGSAGRRYYQCIAQALPPTYFFKNRNRRPSKDMFNSTLNYLFGMLYGKVELALIKAGLDPFIGIFHTDMYNRPVLVYDVIESYRAWTEKLLLDMCLDKVLEPTHFTKESASLKLNGLGKHLVISQMNDFLSEKIFRNAQTRSREQHILEDCVHFASHIRESVDQDNPE